MRLTVQHTTGALAIEREAQQHQSLCLKLWIIYLQYQQLPGPRGKAPSIASWTDALIVGLTRCWLRRTSNPSDIRSFSVSQKAFPGLPRRLVLGFSLVKAPPRISTTNTLLYMVVFKGFCQRLSIITGPLTPTKQYFSRTDERTETVVPSRRESSLNILPSLDGSSY